MKILFFLFDICKKFPLLIIATTLLLFITNLFDAVSMISLVVIIDNFLSLSLQNSSSISQRIIEILKLTGFPYTFGWLLVLFVIFNMLRVCFQIFSMYYILKTKYVLLRKIMLETFMDFFNSSWYFFSSGKQGTLLNTFMREIVVVGDAFAAMGRYFSIILQILLYLIVPLYLSWQVTTVVILSALFLSIPFFLISKFNYNFGKISTSTANDMTKCLLESLTSAKIILGFGNQNKSLEILEQRYDTHRQVAIKSQTLNYAMPLIYYPLGLLVLIIGLSVSRKTALPLSETAVLFYSLSRVIPLIAGITEQKFRLDFSFPSYEQILSLRQRAQELKQSTGTKIFQRLKKEVIVDKISFVYPNHNLILNNISMIIPRGKMIAIVGNSGAGKSTTIDLIMRFHDPLSGRILVDDTDLKDYDIKSYRQKIGYVPQESVLFNVSVKDNLLWTKKDASDEEIQIACRQAYADEFIANLANGYDTQVGDRGVRLSGGQVQRIALARAILRKPQLLILDEATSALDTYSERLIQQAIENIAKETTVIVVAHRLSTIKNADYVYVIDKGSIIEEGTYSQLTNKDGHFNKMVKLQMLGIEE